MTPRTHLHILVTILIAIGLVTFGYKVTRLDLPLLPKETPEAWEVEAQISFDAHLQPVKAVLHLPPPQQHFSLFDEHDVSGQYGFTKQSRGWQRKATWAFREPKGKQTLYYRALFFAHDNPDRLLPAPAKNDRYPFLHTWEGAEKVAADALLSDVKSQSADTATLASALIKRLHQKEDPNVTVLIKRNRSIKHIAQLSAQLLSQAEIPTQLIHGLLLTDKVQYREEEGTKTLLAVWSSPQWLFFDPKTGVQGLPQNYLIWWSGSQPALEVSGARNPQVHFFVKSSYLSVADIASYFAQQSGSQLMNFSLLSLPVETQQVYQILLMIPIGAFVIILLRSFIGFKTFGTFMPVLVALAFRETHLMAGIVLFVMIVGLGLLIRFYLEHLKLLLVPRLGTVLGIVVILMAVLSILSNKLGIQRGLSVALFPMVILTMTIERMSIVWEERHPLEAIQQATGSLIAACMAYAAMFNRYCEHLFFIFPELLLVLLGLMLLTGRYRGYRLTELWRFKSLTESMKQS